MLLLGGCAGAPLVSVSASPQALGPCAAEVEALGRGAPIPGPGTMSRGGVWIGDFIAKPEGGEAPAGEMVALRFDFRGDGQTFATWRASDGPLPEGAAIGDGARWLTVQAVARTNDGACVRGARDFDLGDEATVLFGVGLSLVPGDDATGRAPRVQIDYAPMPTYAVTHPF